MTLVVGLDFLILERDLNRFELLSLTPKPADTGKGLPFFYFFTIHFSLHCSVLHRLAVRRESYVLPTPWSRLPVGRLYAFPPPAPSRAQIQEIFVTSLAREGGFNFNI